jgi:fibronectin-binding autotransporter adhesin
MRFECTNFLQDLSVGRDNVRSLQPYVQIAFDKAFGNEVRSTSKCAVATRELLGTGRTVTVGMQNGTPVAAPVRACRAIR